MNDVIIIINSGDPVKTKNTLLVTCNGGITFQTNSNYVVNSGIVISSYDRLDIRFSGT